MAIGLVYLIAIVVSFVVYYYVAKIAVKNGVLDALKHWYTTNKDIPKANSKEKSGR